MFNKQKFAAGLGLATAAMSTSALAAFDAAGVTTAVSEATTAIATIGAAVLIMIVGAKVYKWVRRAL